VTPKHLLRVIACAICGLLLFPTPIPAQPRKEDPGKGSDLFLAAARKLLRWDEEAEPFQIVGPIYFIGTKGLGSYLITGSEGHIVLNTGMPGSGPMIAKSIKTLGFKLEDVKLILTGHSHVDHVGGHAHLKKVTGAKVAMIREEKELYESGGKLDFQYAASKDFHFDPTEVATVMRDGDVIKVGDVSIRTILTPGHTKGSATYSTNVSHNGENYSVVFPDGTSVNPGYRLSVKPSYEGIGDDFRRTFRVLGSLKPDIWLTAHNDACGLDMKRTRAAKDGIKAWIDPEGYRKWVAAQREAFETVAGKE
jgi:metallo-beta-lactamase class B